MSACNSIVSFAEAKEKGLKRFFTGVACARGHLAERITSSRVCVECVQDNYATNPVKQKAASKAWYARNAGRINAKAAKARAAKIHPVPVFADDAKIAAIYQEAAELQQQFGIAMRVVYHIPLWAKDVWGLHVPTNLKVVTAAEACGADMEALKTSPRERIERAIQNNRRLELRIARRRARKDFESERGWKFSAKKFALQELLQGKLCGPSDELYRQRREECHWHGEVDHAEYLNVGTRPVAILSHTYCTRNQIAAFANLHGLRTEYLPYSWYAPGGAASAVLFTPAEPASNADLIEGSAA